MYRMRHKIIRIGEGESAMICPKCGGKIPDDSVFCQECGCKLEENRQKRPKRCEICGAYNDWDARFCERCGQPLDDEEPEEEKIDHKIHGKTILLCGIVIAAILGGIAGLMFWDSLQKESKKEAVEEEIVKEDKKEQTADQDQEEEKAQEQTEPIENKDPEKENEYILPESASRLLTSEDIENLSIQELSYARNEIYARYGRKFKSQELQNYFNSKSWYRGIYDPEDFDQNYNDVVLNEIEKKNADFLREKELERNPEGYQLDE